MPAEILREPSYAQIEHPEQLPDGRGLWVAPEVREIQRKLREGDPGAGWEGDPRLALYRAESDPRWYLYRMEADGQYRLVVRSKPGVSLDGLLRWLVEHDARRHYDAVQDMNLQNAAIAAEKDRQAGEKMTAALDKVAFGIRKDVGHATDIAPGNWSVR